MRVVALEPSLAARDDLLVRLEQVPPPARLGASEGALRRIREAEDEDLVRQCRTQYLRPRLAQPSRAELAPLASAPNESCRAATEASGGSGTRNVMEIASGLGVVAVRPGS